MRRHYILAALGATPLIAYSVLFFGMMIEGDLLVFTTGFLIHHRAFDPWDAFFVALAGCVIGDFLWYLLGRTDTSHNKILRWLGEATDKIGGRIDAHISVRTFRTLFISKFIYGVHHFTLVRAGRRGVPLGKLFKNDVPASALWIIIVGALGYLASASFELVRRRVHYLEIALLLAVALYFIFVEIIGKFLKKRL
jgi:membrane-associated protein